MAEREISTDKSVWGKNSSVGIELGKKETLFLISSVAKIAPIRLEGLSFLNLLTFIG